MTKPQDRSEPRTANRKCKIKQAFKPIPVRTPRLEIVKEGRGWFVMQGDKVVGGRFDELLEAEAFKLRKEQIDKDILRWMR